MTVFARFDYPITTPTEQIQITSSAPILPIDAGHATNHVITESTDGTRQTATLGDDRKILRINFEYLDDTDFNALESFINDDILLGLQPFTYIDFIRNESWNMWLESVEMGHRRGNKHFIRMTMKEQV